MAEQSPRVISRDAHFVVKSRGGSQTQKSWIQRPVGAISAKIIREGSPYLTMQEERRKGIEIDNSSGLNLRAPPFSPPSPTSHEVRKGLKR